VTAAQRQFADMVERWPDDFFRRKALPLYEAAAAEAARFLRAPASSVVFVENATSGVNAVLASLKLQRGDAVNLALWTRMVKASAKMFDTVYRALGVDAVSAARVLLAHAAGGALAGDTGAVALAAAALALCGGVRVT
jgi:hypothetical protein